MCRVKMVAKSLYLVILASSFFASVAHQSPDCVYCSSTEFCCHDAGCIDYKYVCNGVGDCTDGSDELGCDKLSFFLSIIHTSQAESCRKNEWTCRDGSCIASRFRCDGVVDCEDGSDETVDTCLNRDRHQSGKFGNNYYQLENMDTISSKTGANTVNPILNNCILPDYPAFGRYNTNIPNAKPGDVYDSVTIEVTCQPGFKVVGLSREVKCQNGEWLAPMPNCSLHCHLPSDSTIEYVCLLSGREIGIRNCSESEPVGTLVSPKCRLHYFSPTPILYMRCDALGYWDNVPRCIPECGTLTPEGTGLITGGTAAKKAEVPWHAGIYTKTKIPYDQICGGSLISSNIVISAAHCFWSELLGKLPAEEYALAVGKIYRPWDDNVDEAQRSDVKELHVPEHFQGSTSHFQSDIAIMITKEYFKFNVYIRPVCVDFNTNFQRIQLRPGEKGKVAGWGLTNKNQVSQVLQVIELPYISTGQLQFRAYISTDKICAGFNKAGKAVCRGDSGGGLAFPTFEKDTKRYYLRGIASTAPANDLDTCNAFAYTAFTELQLHEHFIKQFLTADYTHVPGTSYSAPVVYPSMETPALAGPSPAFSGLPGYPALGSPPFAVSVPAVGLASVMPGATAEKAGPDMSQGTNHSASGDNISSVTIDHKANCRLPDYPAHGKYVTNGPEAIPGDAFLNIVVNITCNKGYGVTGSSSVSCSNGHWSEEFPKCVSQCHLKQHPSVEYRCLDPTYLGHRPCKEYEITGTEVLPQCRAPYYYSVTALHSMKCVGGSWDYVPRCLPECGRALPTSDMQAAKRIEVPWHAGIYKKSDNQFTLTCGGSLISNSVVLSAGRCFWSDSESRLLPVSNYAVAVGKLYRPWNDNRDEYDAQRSDVKAINLPERYLGSAANFQADLAVVIVKRPFTYTLLVRPVCVDFDINYEKYQLQPFNSGKMAGWPTSGGANSPQVLQVIDLPYVSVSTCISESSLGLRKYITSDKICAGTKGIESMCNGGSGLAFPDNNPGRPQRFYIRGILSTSPNNRNCTAASTFLTFTQILKHEHFIKQFWGDTDADNDADRLQKGDCKLPDYPAHGTYVTNIPDAKPGDAFDSVAINVTCEQGYEVSGPNMVYCYNGWWPEKFPLCISQCLLKPDPSVEYRCLVSGPVDSYRPCNENEPSGTVASPQCRQPHYSEATLPFMYCIDGNWNYIAKCAPVCGIVTPDSRQGVNGGTSSAKRGEVPWHADIYTKTTHPHKQICGGSLISDSVVISAAHCFRSKGSLTPQPASNFAVAVGKLFYRWEDSQDEAQRSDVLKVQLPDGLDSIERQYDIAIVTVVKPFELKQFIRPVCLDFGGSFESSQLQKVQIGKVAGWGLTSGENSRRYLKVTDVSFVDVTTCISDAPEQLRQVKTEDKICGNITDSAVCAGDGGTGLVFSHTDGDTEKYYLRGVLASVTKFEDKCSESGDVALFTRLQTQQHFIKQSTKKL